MLNVPAHFQDAKTLLTDSGFTVGGDWYHGTSSALVDSIKEHGLKRSGDKALKQAAKQSMATIGHSFSEANEPVFLTQSKELAFYWASQAVRNRSVRFEGTEEPVVLQVEFPEGIDAKVQPDVGAAGLLVIGGEDFLEHLGKIYKANDLSLPEINPKSADRMDYLNILGMAYIDQDIDAELVNVVST